MKKLSLLIAAFSIFSLFGQTKMFIWKNNTIIDSMAITNDLKISFKSTSTANVVGYWKMDELNGTSISDLSGFNNNGVADTSCYIVSGYSGNGRKVPNVNTISGITIPNATSINLNGPFTLECFIKINEYEQNGISLIRKENSYGLALGSFSSAGYLQLFIDPLILQTDIQIPVNKWVHVAGTWDGTTANLYIDYNLVKSIAYSHPISIVSNQLWFARTGNDVLPNTSTIIDEIRISKTALQPINFLK